jgi:quinol monooxygenase YgiN
MIIVRGAAVLTPETLPEMLRLSLEHVARSRLEPGCVSHEVAIDAENPNRLVFFERWEDEAALKAHFQVPESIAFAKALRAQAADKGEMVLYHSQKVRL